MPRKELISGEWKKVCSKADCHKAGIPQPIEGFSKDKNTSDGLSYQCKKCVKAHDAQPENKARKKARMKAYHAENKARKKEQRAEHYANNRERLLAQQAEYYANNREHKLVQQAEYDALPENKARKKAQQTEHRAQPEIKARINQRARERWRSDPVYRTKCILSKSIRQALKANGGTKGGKTFDYLPYSPEGLMEHLEKQFDEHMTWDNHGTYWHIDHIRPHASFKYDSLDHPDFQKCWALENLRPLKASENISKGSLWEGKRQSRSEAA